MAKQIFCVYSCDEWDSNARLIFVGTSSRKLKMFVSSEIEKGSMDYRADKDLTPKQQAKEFRSDWEKLPRRLINCELTYGFIEYCYDNDPESI